MAGGGPHPIGWVLGARLWAENSGRTDLPYKLFHRESRLTTAPDEQKRKRKNRQVGDNTITHTIRTEKKKFFFVKWNCWELSDTEVDAHNHTTRLQVKPPFQHVLEIRHI